MVWFGLTSLSLREKFVLGPVHRYLLHSKKANNNRERKERKKRAGNVGKGKKRGKK